MSQTTKQKPPGKLKAALLGMVAGWYGRHVVLGDPFDGWLGTVNSWTGERVDSRVTLQLGTAMACIRLISETGSTLPFGMFRTKRDGSREFAGNHQLYQLLHHQPNADMTAVAFWQAFWACLLLWGNAYVEKKLNADGFLVALEILLPDAVERRVIDGRVTWHYTESDGKVRKIPETRMWHTPAFSVDGKIGLSPIGYGSQVFGSAIAADRASAQTFKSGMKSPGIITVDAVLKADQREQIRAHVKSVQDRGEFMVFEKGTGFHRLSMNPQDAELLSTRAFNVEEICRWFRVPPFMVGHSEKSTSWGTGIEQQMIGFVTFVLRPWCVRIEQSIRKNLLAPVEQGSYSAEFALEGLLRGDSGARSAFYASAGQNGWMTRNEMRRLENLPPVEGGDVLTVQSNLIPIDKLGQAPAGAAAADALKAWLGITETKDEA